MLLDPLRPSPRISLALIVVALAGFALAAVMHPARAAASTSAKAGSERLVVRGKATVVDRCTAGGCRIELTGGTFRGTPVGSGAYGGRLALAIAEGFSNGEGGVCAPVRGRIVLGAGSPDRLVLAVAGDSCQDGAGDPTLASFTGLARFVVKRGTGAYAGATGRGHLLSAEDAADRDRMTIIGRIAR